MKRCWLECVLLAWAVWLPASAPASSYAWSFQGILKVASAGGGVGWAPSHLVGRGFVAVISGYDRNTTGVYVHTSDEGLALRGGYVWSQQQKLVPADSVPGQTQSEQQFGKWMVHDKTTLIVSAPGMGPGHVYVFNGTLRHWSQVQELVPIDGATGDKFGEFLALDNNRLVISAPGARSSKGPNVGAAYVYERRPGNLQWSHDSKLIARDGQQDIEPGSKAFKSVSVLNDWVVGGSNWDEPTVSGYCSTTGASQTRTCQVDQMTGSAYLFKLQSGVGWSQQQKLVSDDLLQRSSATHVNKLGSRRFGSDVRLVDTNTMPCAGQVGCPDPIKVLAVSCDNAYSADTVRSEVLVYGISSTGGTWSLQQQLFSNYTHQADLVDLGGFASSSNNAAGSASINPSSYVVNRTAIFANDDTLVANFVGPTTSLSYVFRTSRQGPLGTPSNLLGAWSLQQILSGFDLGQIPLVAPVVRGGTLLHGNGNDSIVLHTRFHNGSCLLLHLTDHRGDGWDTALLTMRAPDKTQDSFYPHCDQPDPFYIRYCPYQPEDTGIYILKVYMPTRARFFWEISYRVQVESTGDWYKGDFSTKMRFSFQNNTENGKFEFQFYDAENLIDPNIDSRGTGCMRCSRISRETWADQQISRPSFFPFVFWNAYYYISDYQARNVYGSGQVCGEVYKWSCYQMLPDGLYTLRLGRGPLGQDLGIPFGGVAGWRGCGRNGTYNDQLVFQVIMGKCVPQQIFRYKSRCLIPVPLDQAAIVANSSTYTAPTAAGTTSPTQNVFGPEYHQYHMYALDETGRQRISYTRDPLTGALSKTDHGTGSSSLRKEAAIDAEKRRLYSGSVTAGAGWSKSDIEVPTRDGQFKSQAEEVLGKEFITVDEDRGPDELVWSAIEGRAHAANQAAALGRRSAANDGLDLGKSGFGALREVLMQEAHTRARAGDDSSLEADPDELLREKINAASQKHGISWIRDNGAGYSGPDFTDKEQHF